MNIINELQNNTNVFLLISGILGLAIGSFVNVAIYRLPIMLKNSWQKECENFLEKKPTPTKSFNLFCPRSHCQKCKSLIPLWHNIPLLSYLILKGKCKNCRARISWRYPLVELLSAAVAIWIAYTYGWSMETGALLLLTWSLIIIIFIDLEHKLIPDNITLPLLWAGLLLNTHGFFVPPETAIIGAICGYMIPWTIANLFKLVRKIDGMGYGDFKLFALFGAWFGWQILLLTITLSALLGSIVGIILILCKKHKFQQELPFGPYIALVGWINIFYGQHLLNWYIKILC